MSVSSTMSSRTFNVSKEEVDLFLIEFAENKIKINKFLKEINKLFEEIERQNDEIGLIEISQSCFKDLKEAQIGSDIFEYFSNKSKNEELVGLLLDKPLKISNELKSLQIRIKTLKEINKLEL
jgi:hypothetical protein